MPSADEVKQLEGVSAAQHRFRLAVNAPEPPVASGPSSASTVANPPPPPPEQPANGPFLYGQLPYRNSRYKEKFQALREKYDRVTAKQQEYHQDLEIATAKIKKLQAENDLLLDAMNLAASHQPSMFGLLPPTHPPDIPPGGGPMDLDAFAHASTSLTADRPPPRHVNGNGSSNGTRSGSSSSGFGPQTNGHPPPLPHDQLQSRPSHPSRQASMEFIQHENGRAP
ncbi:hypothetical protein MVEN_01034000 [Mycena venus]|uniref:Uncharacterized protein n=1 Tax=Mycena venus TaxID=2733690 RepID=A0A8H6YES4_9AGAR|nr:hypothetical protein MVEN_01034000 [Mycena venus]